MRQNYENIILYIWLSLKSAVVSAELGRSEPGGTEQALRDAWVNAREVADDGEAAILLLEEVDCLGGGPAARRVVGQLQALLGASTTNQSDFKACQNRVILVATTSAPELLSAALRRPGRLSTEESANIFDRMECINPWFSGVSYHSRGGSKTGNAEVSCQ